MYSTTPPTYIGPTLKSQFRVDSSVLFASLFLLLFAQIDNICKAEQGSLYICFLQGEYKRNYLKGKKFIWFQRYEFWMDPPLYFMWEVPIILYNRIFLLGPGIFINPIAVAYF